MESTAWQRTHKGPPFFSSTRGRRTGVPFFTPRVHRLLVFSMQTRGMLLPQRPQRQRVHTLVSDQNLQIHSILPSIVIASQNSFCPDLNPTPSISSSVFESHRIPSLTRKPSRETNAVVPHKHKGKTVGIATANTKLQQKWLEPKCLIQLPCV